MSPLDLMMMHCDALYIHNARQELVCVNDWLRGPAPALWIGFTSEGILWRFREDVSIETRARVERLLDEEANAGAGPLPRHHNSYCRLCRSPVATGGPTYWLSDVPPQTGPPVQRLSAADAAILRHSELQAWIPDLSHQQPMFASLQGPHAVAVCASVRISSAAHEAGVETLPNHRRQGHAAAVVAAWARELMRAGIVPLYSTSWDNLPSQGVARHLGFRGFGWEYRTG